MRRLFIGIVFIMICFFQVSVLIAAGSSAVIPAPEMVVSDGEGLSVESLEAMQVFNVSPDGFGGHLYSYKDSNGNKFVSNSQGTISSEILLADTGRSTGEVDVAEGNNDDTEPTSSGIEEDEDFYDPFEDEYSYETISDPLEPINRVFFQFNDKLYFWLLKPVAKGYGAVVPEPARVSVKNFFKNLGFPIRFVNCLLQGKFEGAGDEFSRFMVNSLIGIGGLFDPATKDFGMKPRDEDFGQTLGLYGFGPALYINWPILGPSSFRDTIGTAGDSFLDPMGYICSGSECNMTAKGFKTVNNTSLRIGDYEDLKDAALDPYLAVRDAYFQYRRNKIKE